MVLILETVNPSPNPVLPARWRDAGDAPRVAHVFARRTSSSPNTQARGSDRLQGAGYRHLESCSGAQAAFPSGLADAHGPGLAVHLQRAQLVYRTIFLTRGSAQIAIAEWVECLYNRQRRHSTIGCARSREEPIFHFRGTTGTPAHQQRDGRATPHVGRRAADDDLQTTTERTR